MKTAIATLRSVSPYQQGRFYNVPKLERETHDEYEKRTWRERAHRDEKGNIIIPPMAFKKALEAAAKYTGKQIPGKGKATYTKCFESGILIADPIVLPEKKDNVPGEWLFVPASGISGDGKRVSKCFPTIQKWTGDLLINVLDEIITKPVLADILDAAGKYIGIGVWRPQKKGLNGRFEVAGLVME